jgi:hypothetical protein
MTFPISLAKWLKAQLVWSAIRDWRVWSVVQKNQDISSICFKAYLRSNCVFSARGHRHHWVALVIPPSLFLLLLLGYSFSMLLIAEASHFPCVEWQCYKKSSFVDLNWLYLFF